MSRSRKRSPVAWATGAWSEKRDKREWHQRMRAMERKTLFHDEPQPYPLPRDAADARTFAKEGKGWVGDPWRDPDRLMRK